MPPSRFRGDTLLLTPSTPDEPSPQVLFGTTRGSTTADRGYLSFSALDADGLFSDREEHYEMPTSGGRAHAIDLLSKSLPSAAAKAGVWIVMTDDDDHAASAEGGNGVRILEWDGWDTGGVKEVGGWPGLGDRMVWQTENNNMLGGSHAIWLD